MTELIEIIHHDVVPVDVLAENAAAATRAMSGQDYCASACARSCHYGARSSLPSNPTEGSDRDWRLLLRQIADEFDRKQRLYDHLFTLDLDGDDLFTVFLDGLPPGDRQGHACRTCRAMFARYSQLTFLDDRGRPVSPFPESAPGIYGPALEAVKERTMKAGASGFYVPETQTLGTPGSGGFTHFSVKFAKSGGRLRGETAYQRQAKLTEDLKLVHRALKDFSRDDVARAKAEFQTLPQNGKFLAMLDWLYRLMEIPEGRWRRNLIRLEVAKAPEGHAHLRNTCVGEFMIDAAQKGVEHARKEYEKKLDPTRYMRPQAAPAEGAIGAAERKVDQLGLETAFQRRYASLEDLENWIWQPSKTESRPTASGRTGFFSDVETKRPVRHTTTTGPVRMTLHKFRKTVLSEALGMEMMAYTGHWGHLLTASDPAAEPIIAWDRKEKRNPVSFYLYPTGSYASQWGLLTYQWYPVTGLHALPWEGSHWKARKRGLFVLVAGAKDTRDPGGSCLFPEFIDPALREVRSVIEAKSKRLRLSEPANGQPRAGGIFLEEDAKGDWGRIHLRVTKRDRTVTEYILTEYE
jgi:hypothetical protein